MEKWFRRPLLELGSNGRSLERLWFIIILYHEAEMYWPSASTRHIAGAVLLTK